jgi:hypothetical protein
VALLSGNPGLLASTLLLGAGALVVLMLAVLMGRQGLSLRPVLWFALVFLLIVGPQLAIHLQRALAAGAPAASAAAGGWWNSATEAPADAAAVARLLGRPADGAMATDLAPLFASTGTPARWARFVVLDGGRTAIVAAFDDDAGAARGVATWLAASGLTDLVRGDPASGFSGARPAGDRLFVRALGRHMVVWTAADASTLRAFVADSPVPVGIVDGMTHERGDAVVEPPPFGLSWPAALALLGAYTLFVSLVFIKGAAWASALPAHAVAPVGDAELRQRLLALDSGEAPFSIRAGAQPDELIVEWRYRDARWIDHARAHAARRTHKLVLRVDESARGVFVSEYQSALNASAGADGARLDWQFSAGIVFYQYQVERVIGVQLDASGRPTGALSAEWRFDGEAMKSPLREIVRRAGWDWRPVLWDAPPTLRWLFA